MKTPSKRVARYFAAWVAAVIVSAGWIPDAGEEELTDFLTLALEFGALFLGQYFWGSREHGRNHQSGNEQSADSGRSAGPAGVPRPAGEQLETTAEGGAKDP